MAPAKWGFLRIRAAVASKGSSHGAKWTQFACREVVSGFRSGSTQGLELRPMGMTAGKLEQ